MTNEEVRSRYSLSKWHGIVLFILMFLMAVGLATSLYVIVDFSLGNEIDYPVMSICSLLAFLFFAVYSIWGYKMRILSFQIIVFYIAACFLALGIDYYCRAGWGHGTECLVLAVFLIGFALTIKKTEWHPAGSCRDCPWHSTLGCDF